MDTTPLRDAYGVLLDASATVAESGGSSLVLPPGEWNADQILAHITLVNAITITAVSTITSGANTTYDNRIAADTWTIERAIALSGGNAGLRNRIQSQGDALCVLAGPMLSDAELDSLVPTRLTSNGTVMVDQPLPLRDLITGLVDGELPGHTTQLLALLASDAVGE